MDTNVNNQQIEISEAYIRAVFNRAKEPIGPPGFEANWQDQPSRYKFYPHSEQVALDHEIPAELGSLDSILEKYQNGISQPETWSINKLSHLLFLSHGVLARRIAVNWNPNGDSRLMYANSLYGRGTPSGGGLYPTEIYLATGQTLGLRAGFYHYNNAHHSLQLLHSGRVVPQIREALRGHPAVSETDSFLLLGLNFWKNAFKYNTFSYHVVTQDLGALSGSIRVLGLALGHDLPFFFWYDDQKLNRIAGLETLSESVFAVIPLPNVNKPSCFNTSWAASSKNLVQQKSYQRSKKLQAFPTIQEVHQAALVENLPRPVWVPEQSKSLEKAPDTRAFVSLPQPQLLDRDVVQAFRNRHSSFGRFSSYKPVTSKELSTVLNFATKARSFWSDVKDGDRNAPFTKVSLFLNHVADLPNGAFEYDEANNQLITIKQANFRHFLQKNYFLQNYNLAETAVVIGITANTKAILNAFGNRGYRILNAEVGLITQNIYLAASALELGCGAILGFENIEITKALTPSEIKDQETLLLILMGHQTPTQAGFASQL